MKAKCKCASGFTCLYCCARKSHEAYLAQVYRNCAPEDREAAYQADRYHSDDASRVTGGRV